MLLLTSQLPSIRLRLPCAVPRPQRIAIRLCRSAAALTHVRASGEWPCKLWALSSAHRHGTPSVARSVGFDERALHAHNDLRAKSTGCVHRSVCCQALLSASRVNERAAELRAHNRIRVKGADVPLPVSDFDELLPLGVPRPLHRTHAHARTQHNTTHAHTLRERARGEACSTAVPRGCPSTASCRSRIDKPSCVGCLPACACGLVGGV